MVDEVEKHVAEAPATHKKNVQKWAVACCVFIVLGLILILMINTLTGSDDNEVPPVAVEDTVENREKSRPTINNRKQLEDQIKLRKETVRIEAENHSNAEDNQALAQKDKFNQQKPNRFSAKTDENKYLKDWQKQEQIRALQSRQSGFGFKLPNNNKQGNEPTLAQQLKASENFRVPETGSLEDRQRIINDQINANNELIRRIEAGELNNANVSNTSLLSASQVPKKNPLPKVVGITRSNAKGEDLQGKTLLPTGTIVSAVLGQTTISDYPGAFKAIITHDVYGPNYEDILIPKGSEIIGKSVTISNVNEPIQARMGLTVNWVVLPNGDRIDFSRAQALDRMGIGALKDKVNYHFIPQILGVAAYAVLSSETGQNQSSTFSGDVNIEGDIGRSLREQFAPVAQKYLSLVPTVTLRRGLPLKVFIEDDLFIKPWGNVYDKFISAY